MTPKYKHSDRTNGERFLQKTFFNVYGKDIGLATNFIAKPILIVSVKDQAMRKQWKLSILPKNLFFFF